jgi:hypothetical protein
MQELRCIKNPRDGKVRRASILETGLDSSQFIPVLLLSLTEAVAALGKSRARPVTIPKDRRDVVDLTNKMVLLRSALSRD